MPHPLVVNMLEETFDIFIGRPSKWGNPFKLRVARMGMDLAARRVARAKALADYEAWILTQPELVASLPELRGKVLGCYCAPLPCHGDILARLANP